MAPYSGGEMSQMELAAKARQDREEALSRGDYIEVVRCRDCRRRWLNIRGKWECPEMSSTIDAGYCYRGDKKDA